MRPALALVDPADQPDVAVPGADRRATSRQEVEPEGRIWRSQGLLSGMVSTSTANGPTSRPIAA